jgi:hypothetical protein
VITTKNISDMVEALNNSQAAVLLSIPKTDRMSMQCEVAASPQEYEDMVLAMIINLARVVHGNDEKFGAASVSDQIRMGLSVINRITSDYLNDPIN